MPRFAATVIGFVVTLGAYAQCAPTLQLAPNPNPGGNNIQYREEACNSVSFVNNGAISALFGNFAPLTNYGLFENNGSLSGVSGFLRNEGTIIHNAGGTTGNEWAISNTGSFTNRGHINKLAGLDNIGQFTNSGLLESEGGSINRGLLTNAQGAEIRLHSEGGGFLTNQAGATINNSGHISFLGVGALRNEGTFDNQATGTIQLTDFRLVQNTGRITNSGQLSVADGTGTIPRISGTGTFAQSGGVLDVQGVMSQGSVNIYGGTLQGTGTVGSVVNIAGGTVAPGNSPGTLTIAGDLNFTTGTLDIEIGGTAPGTYDVLAITGRGSFLAGLFSFSFIEGFLPHFGDSWTFLTAAGGLIEIENLATSFFFSHPGGGAQFSFELALNDAHTALTLTVAPIPEPQTYALLLLGLALLTFEMRRRSKLQHTAA
jgi:hypothetical protein